MSRRNMSYTIGIDIGSTTVKVAVLDDEHHILFSDYQRHFADIKGTLARLVEDARSKLGELDVKPMSHSHRRLSV